MFVNKIKYEKGNAKIMPSILSNKPPWPGINLPVSLILESLLKYEITRSPNWLIVEIKNEKINKWVLSFIEESIIKNLNKKKDDNIGNK